MSKSRPASRIRLSDERRAQIRESLKIYFSDELDQELSDFRASALMDFIIKEFGPPIYNQGIRDAASYMQAKIADIDVDVYEREP